MITLPKSCLNFPTKNIIRSFLRFFRTVFPFLHVCNPLVFYREEIFFKKTFKKRLYKILK
ncbi:hypothetical protein DW107_11000 [Tannerella sp. AM09-19]|nr:hypothetical protein DW107_11000 [Tannerella sp. AM09-19]